MTTKETVFAQARTITDGVRVRDAMSRTFHNLHPAHFAEHAAALLHRGYYDDFPVVRGGAVVGMLRQRDLLQAIRLQHLNVQVADLMHRGCLEVQENDLLSDAIVQMKQCGCTTLAVVRDGRIVGTLSQEHLDKWMTIQAALRDHQSHLEIPLAAPSEART